jgi:hypothetical protein
MADLIEYSMVANVLEYEDFINAIKCTYGKSYIEVREMSFKFNYQQEILFFNFYPLTSRKGKTVGFELLWMPSLNGIDNCNIKGIELGKGKFPYDEKKVSSRDISKILEAVIHGIKKVRVNCFGEY